MKSKTELHQRIKKQKSCVLVVNTYSRKGEKLFFQSLDSLQKKGITVTASYPVRNPDDLARTVKEAIRRKGDLVVIGGGDGTVSSIVDHFAYKDVVFGLLPLGTGNSFARTLSIPLELEKAVDVIANGKVAEIDLGKVGDDYFANVVSIGFPTEVALHTPKLLKRIIGPLAYLAFGLYKLFTTKRFTCEITIQGTKKRVETHQIIVANGEYFGVSPLGLGARVTSKRLLVITMEMFNRWEIIHFWMRFLLGKHTNIKQLHRYESNKITISTDPPRKVDVDGEVTTKTPVIVTVAEKALKIIVPQTFRE